MFSASILKGIESLQRQAMDCVAVFRDKAGAQIGSSVKCRVIEAELNPAEQQQGARTTGIARYDLVFPKGTVVRDFYRIFVTHATGETIQYHAVKGLQPTSHSTCVYVRCEKQD